MIKAVLFDLDGTLLDIDLAGFLQDYFVALGPVIGQITGSSPAAAIDAVLAATAAMDAPHPGTTNRDAFDAAFMAATATDISSPEALGVIDVFYKEQFPLLQGPHGPMPGGLEAVLAARDLGLRVAVATNPIFPLVAIEERMRWAGLENVAFGTVTCYETSVATKPHPQYYRSVAQELGVLPTECLMVGDDPVLDLAAGDVGMKTYYVGPDVPVVADWKGTLHELPGLLSRLAE